MRPASKFLQWATVSMFAGCTGLRPAPPPAAAVGAPAAWRTSVSSAQVAPLERWWESFGDPVLNRLIERAVEYNADIGQAASRVAEARAIADGAHASRLTELDFTTSYSDARSVTLGIATTAFGGGGELAVAWDADLFGRLKSADLAAHAQWLSSRAARDAIVLAVVADAAQTYVELLGADARLQILRETLDSRERSLSVARRLTANGYASRLELFEAEGEYQSAAQLVPQAELDVSTLENAVSVLTGNLPRMVDRSGAGLAALSTPAIPVELPSYLLQHRPDLVAAEDALVAADHQLDSARAAMLPNVMLAGALGGVYANTLPNPLTIFSLGGSILAPLFDAGRRRSEAEVRAAQRDRAAYAYRAVVLTAFREVEDSLAAIGKLRAQREASLLEAAADAERLRIVVRRRELGYASSIDRLDAERRLLAARLAAVRSDTACFANYVKLARATGGGWSRVAQPD